MTPPPWLLAAISAASTIVPLAGASVARAQTPPPETPPPEQPAEAPAMSEAEIDAIIAEAEADAETIIVWDERPEKPFDRDTDLRLTSEDLAEQGATDLATALQLLPDVTVRDVGRGGFNLDIRGARKGAVRVLIDGVAVSDPFYGTFDVSTIPVTDIEQVRVSTAPASPIDGPGGPGGVVEVHTRDAIGDPLVVARLTSDSMPNVGASATGRTPLAEHVGLRLSASSTLGFHEYDTASDAVAADDRRATTGALRLEHRDGGRRAVVDGFVDDRRYLSPPSDELATALFLLIDRETTGRIGVGFDDDLGADKKLQVQLRGWTHAMRRVSRNYQDPALTMQTSSEELFSMRSGALGLLTRPIGRDARWVGSVTVDHERARAVTTTTAETVARGEVTIVEAAGGGQYERGAFVLDGAAGVAVPAGLGAAPWPEAKLSATYRRDRGAIELIGARKGRVPSLRERFQGSGANLALDPEHAWHGEVRLTGRPREGVELVLAPYARRTTGTVKVGMDSVLVNLGELNVRGVDASARAQLLEQLAIGGAYQYAVATSDDLGPDPIDRFPAHRVDGWVEGSPIERAAVRVRGRYAGRAVDRGEATPAYVTWDVSASLQHRGWLAAVRCDDVLDAAPETRLGFHMPGRVFSLVVQHTWD